MIDEDRELAKLHNELEKLKKELERERVWIIYVALDSNGRRPFELGSDGLPLAI